MSNCITFQQKELGIPCDYAKSKFFELIRRAVQMKGPPKNSDIVSVDQILWYYLKDATVDVDGAILIRLNEIGDHPRHCWRSWRQFINFVSPLLTRKVSCRLSISDEGDPGFHDTKVVFDPAKFECWSGWEELNA
jgi:hypothetical protein